MPSPEILAAGAVLIGLIMYTDFAGADFGSGIWTALASGPRAREQREELFNAIGPIWETHHVWLIFVIVTLFTCLPHAFGALFIALLAPLVIALVGINFRGAAFGFRHFGQETRHHLPFTAQVFSVSSALTPFTLGMAFSATAAGRIHIVNGQVQADFWSSWITPFTFVGGLVALAICAFLTPIYMCVRTHDELREDFRKRGLIAALVLGVVTTLALPVAWFEEPNFAERLLSPVPLIVVAGGIVCGVATLFFLWTRRYIFAQVTAPAAVAAVLVGFGLALFPYILIDQMTIAQAAAPRESIVAYLTILPFGAIILVPSLLLLYWIFLGEPKPEVKAKGT
ncbi:MAG: cytochrome d ubiquinol oxidase subunit II [Chloroflexi bacterium]|nr:cytochrome d ubiquinol oxidase subunit II [Chloroflexota bacterium]